MRRAAAIIGRTATLAGLVVIGFLFGRAGAPVEHVPFPVPYSTAAPPLYKALVGKDVPLDGPVISRTDDRKMVTCYGDVEDYYLMLRRQGVVPRTTFEAVP